MDLELQPLSEELIRTKYMINGETSIDQVYRDVADAIAQPETSKKRDEVREQFYKLLSTGKFLPGGRILANARTYANKKSKNLNNCFTIDIEDSMEGIYSSLYEDAMISRMGGGVGFDVSKLRPEGSKTSNGGESSGPLSFLQVFDASAKTIQSGGARRSAHIALMDISHPDIENFITAKQGDKYKNLTQFNISVKITDAFMKACEEDANWDLVFEGKVYKTLKAKDLYNKLVKNAFEHNEPGVFFVDTTERYNNAPWAFKLDRTNPCVSGNTLINTDKGSISMKELHDRISSGEIFKALSYDEVSETQSFEVIESSYLTKRDAVVIELEIEKDDGTISKVICTPDHKFFTRNRGYVEAKDLTGEDDILTQ